MCNHRVGEANGGRSIEITDPVCIAEVYSKLTDDGPAKPMHNVVQYAQWPEQPFVSLGSSSAVIDVTDQPGSWSALPAGAQPAQSMHPSMAHTMRMGRILRPVYDGQLNKVGMHIQHMLLCLMPKIYAQQPLHLSVGQVGNICLTFFVWCASWKPRSQCSVYQLMKQNSYSLISNLTACRQGMDLCSWPQQRFGTSWQSALNCQSRSQAKSLK